MASYELSLPGQFEDAFVYMGWIVAITTDREIVATSLDKVLTSIGEEGESPLVQDFLADNRGLHDENFARILLDPIVHQAVSRSARHYECRADWQPLEIEQRHLGAGSVLDFNIYAQRFFISTTDGLYSLDVDFDDFDLAHSGVRRRLDARCLSTSVSHSIVTASCDDDGLFAAKESFDERASRQPPLRPYAAKSMRSSWMFYSLMNYPSPTSLELFKSTVEKDQFGKNDVKELRHGSEDVKLGSSRQKPDFVFNNGRTFFTHYRSGSYELHTRVYNPTRQEVGPKKSVLRKGRIRDALSAHKLGKSIIVEDFDRVYLLRADGIERIYEGCAVKIRTFQSSKRYRNIVCIVDDSAIHLVSPLRNVDALN